MCPWFESRRAQRNVLLRSSFRCLTSITVSPICPQNGPFSSVRDVYGAFRQTMNAATLRRAVRVTPVCSTTVFRGPIAAGLQGDPPGVTKLAPSLVLSGLVILVVSRLTAMPRVERRPT